MLRHSRAQTYVENKKHKEKDRRKSIRKSALYSILRENHNKRLLAKKYGTLIDNIKSWGIL